MTLTVLTERYGTLSDLGYGPKRIAIPAIFDCIVNSMLECDLRVEGIFRRNGQVKAVNELAEKLDSRPNDIVDIISQEKNPVHLASLLKRFLRELPEPLLTHRLQKLFLISQKMPREQDQILVLYFACILLPEVNRNVLEVLLLFLRHVSSFQGNCDSDESSRGNRMDINNLATIIAPNILSYSAKGPGIGGVVENPGQPFDQIIGVVKSLLIHQETIWSVSTFSQYSV